MMTTPRKHPGLSGWPPRHGACLHCRHTVKTQSSLSDRLLTFINILDLAKSKKRHEAAETFNYRNDSGVHFDRH